MRAEIMSIGTEILLGDIVNTNARYLSKRLAELGINVYFQTVVGDNADRIFEAYRIAFNRADFVIVSGGLGPTEDDLTKQIAAQYFNKKMIFQPEVWEPIYKFYTIRGSSPPEAAQKQASFPEGSYILENTNGTAPGCWIEENGKFMAMIPGPPKEMMEMFENQVLVKLKQHLKHTIRSKTLRVCGIGESQAEAMLIDLIHQQTNPTIATYAKEGEVHIRVTARADSREESDKIIKPVMDEIYSILGPFIYGEGEKSLEEKLFSMLSENRLTLSVAESMTGGLVCARLISVSGMSSCLKEGMVTYSNKSKIRQLNVSPETIETFGPVSRETASEMAKGAAKATGSDIGLAVTGWADNSGNTSEAGSIWIAAFINGSLSTKHFQYSGSRNRVRFFGANMAVCWLVQRLKIALDNQHNAGHSNS